MRKLKIILQSSFLYIFLFIITITYSFYYCTHPKYSKLTIEEQSYLGMITEMEIEGDLLKLEMKGKEKIIGNYFFKTEEEKKYFLQNYQLGDYVNLTGNFSLPKKNTVPNLFNYQRYLNRKKIYYIMQIDKIEKILDGDNYLYKIKNKIESHIEKYKSKAYLKTFVLGNKNLLEDKVIKTYQENGISHLFALSGMHVSLLSGILLTLLKKLHINSNKSYLFVVLFLLIYMLLSGCTPSICRAVILFILLGMNQILNLKIKTIFLFILTFCILVMINPNLVFEVGFQYSFIISFYLILMQKKISNIRSYWKGLFFISTLSFLVSLPITIYYFYEINLFSIFLNLLFVPLVSIIVFPLSLLTFLIPFLDPIFFIVTNLMEKIAFFCHHYFLIKSIWMKPNILWIIFYYIVLTLFLCFSKKKFFFCLILLLFYQYFNLILFPKTFFLMIDVGQGDSLLIHSKNQTMLLDTGGKNVYEKEKWQVRTISTLTDSTLLPLLKSLGIRKLDYLVLSHGDLDHCGEAINLIHNMKVENIIFNEGQFNQQEAKIIELLEKEKKSYKIAEKNDEYHIGDFKLISLNSSRNNENDSSIVFLMEIKKYRFLLMGDSSKVVEEKLIQEYKLEKIDFLKIGHHGSKTSTSTDFLNSINPKVALISVGINNRYQHPSKEVIERLKEKKIITFLTSIHGSVQLNFNKNVTFSINPP